MRKGQREVKGEKTGKEGESEDGGEQGEEEGDEMGMGKTYKTHDIHDFLSSIRHSVSNSSMTIGVAAEAQILNEVYIHTSVCASSKRKEKRKKRCE